MSFSTSIGQQKHGSISLDGAREAVTKHDSQWDQTGGQIAVAAVHQKQIDAAEVALTHIAAHFPDKTLIGSVYGHANADGTGNVGISYSFDTGA